MLEFRLDLYNSCKNRAIDHADKDENAVGHTDGLIITNDLSRIGIQAEKVKFKRK